MFCIKLSRQLGIPIKQLLNQVDSEELSLYMAAERLSPMDDPWQRNALNCYVTGRSAGIKCEQKDFMPKQVNKSGKGFQAAIAALAK